MNSVSAREGDSVPDLAAQHPIHPFRFFPPQRMTPLLIEVVTCPHFSTPLQRTAQETGPYTDPGVSWISISGTVDAVHADEFALDYGQGLLTVEMDDVDRNAADYALTPGDTVTVSGIVGEVNPAENEIRVDTGRREITVDASAMPYDPLSEDSFQQIEEGQYVSVLADIDRALFEESEIEADAVISLGG